MLRSFLCIFSLILFILVQFQGLTHSHFEDFKDKNHSPYDCSVCEYQSQIKALKTHVFHLNFVTFSKNPAFNKTKFILVKLNLPSSSLPRAPPKA